MQLPQAVELTSDDRLLILNQTLLPGRLAFIEMRDKPAMLQAIKSLQVRGAPAIGIFAAYCVYVLARRYSGLPRIEFLQAMSADIEQLRGTRPTAVNLAWALARMENVLREHSHEEPRHLLPSLRLEAVNIDHEDAELSRAIAENGEPLIKDGAGVLTHCNAGWLATSRLGTALAPVYLAHERGKALRVYCDETRPQLQGARLTAYELMASGIDTTLICDNMAASMMARGLIDIIFVGADRVAKNGDVANKIGTLSLAVNAAYFGVPFYVCAPGSTFDPATACGGDIVIEQRAADEVTKMWYKEPMAPEGVGVANPAFDVTPRELITGIITENGII